MQDTIIDIIPISDTAALREELSRPEKVSEEKNTTPKEPDKPQSDQEKVKATRDTLKIIARDTKEVEEGKKLLELQKQADLTQENFRSQLTITGLFSAKTVRYDELYQQYYAEGMNGYLDDLKMQRTVFRVSLFFVSCLTTLSAPQQGKDASANRIRFHKAVKEEEEGLRFHIEILTAAIKAVKGDFSGIQAIALREQESLQRKEKHANNQINELDESLVRLGATEIATDYLSHGEKSEVIEMLLLGGEKERIIARTILRRNNLLRRNTQGAIRQGNLEMIDDPTTYTVPPRPRGLERIYQGVKEEIFGKKKVHLAAR